MNSQKSYPLVNYRLNIYDVDFPKFFQKFSDLYFS